MTKKITTAGALILSCSLMLTSSVFAFSDVQGDEAAIVSSLQQKGIVQGVSDGKFIPQGKLTLAQGLQMIVKGLELTGTVDESVKGAWYDKAMSIAKQNGIEIPTGLQVNSVLTKEQFTHMLMNAVNSTGNYPMVKMLIIAADNEEINPEFQGSVLRSLLWKVNSLDKDQKFYPKHEVTRIEAASMLFNAIELVDRYKDLQQENENGKVTHEVVKINDQVNKVVISRGEMGNPGYGIHVEKIEFTTTNEAVIYYKLSDPDPNKMYPQVMTEVQTETYVSSQYKVKVVPIKSEVSPLKSSK